MSGIWKTFFPKTRNGSASLQSWSRITWMKVLCRNCPNCCGKITPIHPFWSFDRLVFWQSFICNFMNMTVSCLKMNWIIFFLSFFLVVESHPDTAPSLRIDKPFPALVDYATSIDFENMDVTDHGHIPYVVILVRVLEDWKRAVSICTLSWITSSELKLFKA